MPELADEFESTGGVDPAAFATDIFPPSSDAGENREGLAAAVSSPASAPPSPASTPAPEGLTQAAWDALPKAWKREMEGDYKTLSPQVRKYIHEREQQVTQGISGYRSGAENWNKVLTPFQEVLKEYPNANPLEILSTLAANHIQMIKASPEERRTHAMALARGYGVDLTPSQAAQVAAAGPAGAVPTEGFTQGQLAELQRMLGPVLAPVRQTTEFINRQIADAATKEVDKFFSDPKNEFVNEVADDILQLMQQGRTNDLAEAYQMAVLRNPEVKARYFEAMARASAPAASKASKLPNVKSSATPASPSKPGSIDDTINSVIAKHYN